MGIRRKKVTKTVTPKRTTQHIQNPAYSGTPGGPQAASTPLRNTPTRTPPTKTTPIRNRLRSRVVGRNGQAVDRPLLSYRGRGANFGIMHNSPTNPRNIMRMQPRVMVENILNLSNYRETSFGTPTQTPRQTPQVTPRNSPTQPPIQPPNPEIPRPSQPIINKNTDGTGPGPSGVQYTKDNTILDESSILKDKKRNYNLRRRLISKFKNNNNKNISTKSNIPLIPMTSFKNKPQILPKPQPKGILKPNIIPKIKPAYPPKHFITNKPPPIRYNPSSKILGWGTDKGVKIKSGVGGILGIGKETTKLGHFIKGTAKAGLIIGLGLTLGQVLYATGQYFQQARIDKMAFDDIHNEIKTVFPRLVLMNRYVKQFQNFKFKHNPFKDTIPKAIQRLADQALNIERLKIAHKNSYFGVRIPQETKDKYVNLYTQILSVVNEVNKTVKPLAIELNNLTYEECVEIHRRKTEKMKQEMEDAEEEDPSKIFPGPGKIPLDEDMKKYINPHTNMSYTEEEWSNLPADIIQKIENGEQVSVGPQTSGDGGIGVAENQPVPPPSISEREREVNEEEAKQDENNITSKSAICPHGRCRQILVEKAVRSTASCRAPAFVQIHHQKRTF
ncbi:ORF2L [Planaria asexual strain-specific virus-like element type 1]|uniref:ORF2L n=1 Tax=Planaria asexual strain-specific virus-like element type 1 TaxID=159252 RepID=UPI00000F1F56|nr:ORF2L [Planaria asexual strain-specific virus-like element type 1]AAK53629.1 ORF2L [Planaria asexual strain-specific virus-like element type 1]